MAMYVADYGEVRVSEREAWLLRLLHDFEGNKIGGYFPERLVSQAHAVRSACEKFAQFRYASKLEAD